jgi:uncharacterized protein YlxW (UPF0749 family)
MSLAEIAPEVTTRVSVDVLAATEGLRFELDRMHLRQHRLRILLGLEREEKVQLQAEIRTLEAKCAQYEAIVTDVLAQLEGRR